MLVRRVRRGPTCDGVAPACPFAAIAVAAESLSSNPEAIEKQEWIGAHR